MSLKVVKRKCLGEEEEEEEKIAKHPMFKQENEN